MPADDEFSDERIAGLLSREAHDSSLKYSALGLQAYLPKRPTSAAPKPNTRFLRNIIRETDSHNAALLAKEKREAREKERALNRKEPGRLSPLHQPPSANSSRSGRQRDHDNDDQSHESRRHRHRRSDRSERSRSRSPRRENQSADRDRHERKRRRLSRSPDDSLRSDRSTEHHDFRRDKRKSKREDFRDDKHVRRHRRRSPSRSSSQSREIHSRSRVKKREKERRSSSRDSETRSRRKAPRVVKKLGSENRLGNSRNTPRGSDSDPLDAIIGPAPPSPEPQVRAKGRGAFHSSSAAMDSHFSSNYNPKADVKPDSDVEDDWEQALEALRDRQKWKEQGADRLRSAGFSEVDIKKWEKGGEKDESDVRWTKRGEDREWDRGKVVLNDRIDLKPSWK